MAQIRTETTGPVGTLVIDNPDRRNAMTLDMYAAVPGAVQDLLATEQLRCIVVRGAGHEAFCAGSNVSEFADHRTGEAARTYAEIEHRAFHAIETAPVPTIAAIHGPCMGGGIAMAAACDLRAATTDATFSVPPAKLGVGYAVDGVETLVRLIGVADTKRLLMTAEVIDAPEALRVGFITHLWPTSEGAHRLDELITTVTRLAPLTLRAVKMAADGRPGAAGAVDACFASADYAEGIAAFTEKRRPVFEGR